MPLDPRAEKETVLREIRAVFRREPRLDLAWPPIALDFEDGVLTIEGEVADIAAKKLALEWAAEHPAVRGIVDRLHVVPAIRMKDSDILAHVRDALLQESAFAECTLRVRLGDRVETVHEPPQESQGTIEVRVEDGVVTLDGEIQSLSHKRLAEVLAWWVPGSRDVVNGLGVEPPQEDNDEEIADAARLVLEKDPFINASQIRVRAQGSVVALEGLVQSEEERRMAELDVWYLFGVDQVLNFLDVRPGGSLGVEHTRP